jgi:hypothetical protein
VRYGVRHRKPQHRRCCEFDSSRKRRRDGCGRYRSLPQRDCRLRFLARAGTFYQGMLVCLQVARVEVDLLTRRFRLSSLTTVLRKRRGHSTRSVTGLSWAKALALLSSRCAMCIWLYTKQYGLGWGLTSPLCLLLRNTSMQRSGALGSMQRCGAMASVETATTSRLLLKPAMVLAEL